MILSVVISFYFPLSSDLFFWQILILVNEKNLFLQSFWIIRLSYFSKFALFPFTFSEKKYLSLKSQIWNHFQIRCESDQSWRVTSKTIQKMSALSCKTSQELSFRCTNFLNFCNAARMIIIHLSNFTSFGEWENLLTIFFEEIKAQKY